MLDLFFFKQKTAYEMRISDWSSDVCSSDLLPGRFRRRLPAAAGRGIPRPAPFRAHLLQPVGDVGGRHCADRDSHGLLHGRRCLRAGGVRRGERKSVVLGRGGSEGVARGGGRIYNTKTITE